MPQYFKFKLAFAGSVILLISFLVLLICIPFGGRDGVVSVVVDPGPLAYKLSDYQRVNDYLTREYGEHSVRVCPIAANRYDIVIHRVGAFDLRWHPNKRLEIIKDIKNMLGSGSDSKSEEAQSSRN